MKTPIKYHRPISVVCLTLGFSVLNTGRLLAQTPHVSASPTFLFSTDDPDGKIGTASRPTSTNQIQIETADDFVLTENTIIDQATFVGLIPSGAALSSISRVEVEIYHVFPTDSTNPPSGNVPTRVNSPADV